MRTPARLAMVLLAALVAPAAASAWTVDLPDSLTVPVGIVRLADLSRTPVPAAVADLLVAEPGSAGDITLVSRQGVLRRLVVQGQAAAVQFTGAPRCLLRFGGVTVDPGLLQAEAERVLGALVPTAPAGAPATWSEVRLSPGTLAVTGAWALTCDRREALPPGRTQVRLLLQDGWQTRELPVSVTVHAHGEAAVARVPLTRGQSLDESQFEWRWVDLAEAPAGLVDSRDRLLGQSATRALLPGDALRQTDLRPTPLVLAGDIVDLLVQRGGIAVRVRALARQAGCLGQTIPVRNELTGRLVNARVAGPGLVEWRR
jgi:flagella basal body P-ring formation protein FlgA